MTERKPRSDSVESWVERQIRDAEQRGAFQNLPGLGKPIPGAGTRHDDSAWLRGYLERENVPVDALLPLPLQLRKEVERLPGEISTIASETEVRRRIDDLNRRIVEWTRAPVGPQIPIRRVDVDETLAEWRSARSHRAQATEPTAQEPQTVQDSPRESRRRWFRRRSKRSP